MSTWDDFQQQDQPQMMRQGDVLLIRVSEPGDLEKRTTRSGRLVLAEGEVTGHAHAIDATTASLHADRMGRRFVHVIDRTELKHEEHAPVVLLPGWYEVRRQREYRAWRSSNIWPFDGDPGPDVRD